MILKTELRRLISATTLALFVSIGAISLASAVERPQVDIDSGTLLGAVTTNAEQFLAMPYAAPPIKDLRFAPPALPAAWSGVREADVQPPGCLQFEPKGALEGQAVSEDCLYLNLFRPQGASAGDKRAVMVYFHGGGLTQGTAVNYGGGSIATETGVIQISANYRVGALGFLAHPALSAESEMGSGNFGIMDQVAVLEWVQRNIEAFGGDPANVTIYGQSAGGRSVCALLAAPSAKGLFHRAIIQSAPCLNASVDIAAAETGGIEYANAVGCTDAAAVVDCLRQAWAPKLIGAPKTYVSSPKVGTGFLPLSPQAAFESGNWNKVPVMAGTTRSEHKLLALFSLPHLVYVTDEGYEAAVAELHDEAAADVLARYPLADYGSAYAALTQAVGDSVFICRVQHSLDAIGTSVPLYQYEFNDPTSPGLYGLEGPGGMDMSNGHSAELQYLFDYDLGAADLDSTQEQLATQLMHYWAAFAKTGNPNFDGGPEWPLRADGQQVMSLRTAGASEAFSSFAEDHHCDFGQSLGK